MSIDLKHMRHGIATTTLFLHQSAFVSIHLNAFGFYFL